jgi:hypothetical protein
MVPVSVANIELFCHSCRQQGALWFQAEKENEEKEDEANLSIDRAIYKVSR